MTELRMKGGVHFRDGRWYMVVHVWPDGNVNKEPTEYIGNESFEDEEKAMRHYKEKVRPMLYKIATDTSKKLNLPVAFTPLE